jgi:hypothetical protein
LQEYVEYIRVGFFDFIKKYHAVGFTADGFGELAAFFVAYVTGRRTDVTGY